MRDTGRAMELADELEDLLGAMHSELRDVMDELVHLGPLVIEETGALDAEEATYDLEPLADSLEQAAGMLLRLWNTFSGLESKLATADKYLTVGQGETRLDSPVELAGRTGAQ